MSEIIKMVVTCSANLGDMIVSDDIADCRKEFANLSEIIKMVVTCSANLGNMIVSDDIVTKC